MEMLRPKPKSGPAKAPSSAPQPAHEGRPHIQGQPHINRSAPPLPGLAPAAEARLPPPNGGMGMPLVQPAPATPPPVILPEKVSLESLLSQARLGPPGVAAAGPRAPAASHPSPAGQPAQPHFNIEQVLQRWGQPSANQATASSRSKAAALHRAGQPPPAGLGLAASHQQAHPQGQLFQLLYF